MPAYSTISTNVQPLMRAATVTAIALGALVVPELLTGAAVALATFRTLSKLN